MPKNIHTPRDELICGKIDKAVEYLASTGRLSGVTKSGGRG